MVLNELRIIETIITILVFLVVRFLINKSVNYHYHTKKHSNQRKKLVLKIFNGIIYSILLIIISSFWGIDQKDIVFFISSILTVIGVAFFAQWSILSNITSGLIMFFNSTLKINEHIEIIDKDFEINGKVLNIGLFVTQILTDRHGIVSIPNNLLIQKMIAHNYNETE